MQTSDTIGKFSAAFVAAQSLVEGAKKDSDNPAFKQGGRVSKYADLSSVWDACKAAVTKHKIGVIQSPGLVVDGKMHMETMLMHESGEWVSGELSIPLQKADAQSYGSCVTYARRYALGAMMGICPEDDDGNAASRPIANDTRQNGQSAASEQSASPPMEGPHKTKTALMAAVKAFMHEVGRAPDPDSLDAYVDSERATIAQVKKYYPGWWDGTATKEPGMEAQIANRRAVVEAELADDTWKRDVTRAG